MLLIHRTGKIDITCFWCKILIKVQQLLIELQSRNYWNISRNIVTKFALRKKVWKCLFYTILVIIIIMIIMIIINKDLRNKNCLIWCSFVHVQGTFNWSKLCFTCHLYFQSFLSCQKHFFNNTLGLSLNINNMKKLKHVLLWEAFCNRITKKSS